MKIALVTRSLARGGVPMQLVNLALGLARRGHVVTVVVLYANGALQSLLESAGISVQCLDKRGRWDMIAPWWRYVRLARRLRFDVIYSYLPLENILSLAVARVTGLRSVWGMRGASQDVRQHGYASALLWGMQRRLIRRAAAVISNSRAAVAELEETANQKVFVIPNGIDTVRFCPDARARRAVREELGVSNDAMVVGCVARLDVIKDHPTFLRAAALIWARQRDACFVVVGSGSPVYRESLLHLADALGIGDAMRWLGERDDIDRIMNALDVYMSASSAEGVSNSLCEAMACGVLPVVTDVGDSRDVVGKYGEVIPPGHAEMLAEAAIARFDIDTPEHKSERRNWIVENFGIDRMVDASLRVFATVVREH